MGKLKSYICILFLTVFGTACFASQISFQVIQHDAGIDSVVESSLVIEDEVLNGFFNKGYIVTNSPTEVSTSENQDETLWKTGIGEAFEGFSDYFIQIKLFYIVSEDKRNRNISNIDWTIAAANTGIVINESSIENKLNINKKDDLRKLTLNLVSQIDKALKA